MVALARAFERHVLQTIRTRRLLEPGERVLCGVSGGADSMVLVHVLDALERALRLDLVVGHVEHGVREDSAQEAQRVRAFAASRGFRFLLRSVRVPGRGTREAALRDARLEALVSMAAEAGAARIALGHTASDRAETMLLFLARGAGRRGLSSMRPERAPFVRPLCDETRASVRAYAEAVALPFVDDPTGKDLRIGRNRVRSRILPELRALNPRVDAHVAALADDFADDEHALLHEAAQQLALASRPSPSKAPATPHIALRAESLRTAPPAIQRRALRLAWEELAAPAPPMLERAHLEALRALLDATGERVCVLPHGEARRVGGDLVLSHGAIAPPRDAPSSPIEVRAPGAVSPCDGINFAFDLLDPEEASAPERSPCALFDAAGVSFPLWIRPPARGDRLRLEGGGRQSLADAFTNARVPRSMRPKWWVVCDENEVLWAPGIRRSARARPRSHTRRVLRITAHGLMFGDPYVNS
jgi:tRNA(Ile)-lysidine synthase